MLDCFVVGIAEEVEVGWLLVGNQKAPTNIVWKLRDFYSLRPDCTNVTVILCLVNESLK